VSKLHPFQLKKSILINLGLFYFKIQQLQKHNRQWQKKFRVGTRYGTSISVKHFNFNEYLKSNRIQNHTVIQADNDIYIILKYQQDIKT